MQIGAVAKYDHDRAEGPLAKLAADSAGIIKVRMLSCKQDLPCCVSMSHITANGGLVLVLLSQASAKQLNDKSAKAKAGALLLLQQLVAVQSDSMQSQIGLLLPALVAILNVRANS